MPGNRKVRGLLTLATLLFAAPVIRADVLFDFSNDGSGTWHDSSNWDQGYVPGGADHVVTIDRSGADPIITYSASSGTRQIKSLSSSESLVFSGGSLEILETANLSASLSLSGGTLIGGVITTSNGIETNSSGSNALQGVTLNGAINLTGSSDRVAIYNSLTLNGTADLSGSSSILEFDGGTQTLGADAGQSTTIDIGTTTSTVRVLNGGQLTLEDTVTVEGRGMLRGYGSGNTITSDGLIHANESSGYILIDPDNFTNTGTLRVSNGSALSLAGNWDNQGTIELNEGTLNLYDDFTTANINQSTFTRGSSTEVRLWGNLDNTGEVLDAIGDIHLHSSSSSVAGTIIGGTVNVDLHVTSGAYESVDGVTLNGTAHLTGGSDRLRVYNSLTLNGTADLSGSSSILEFDGGTQTLGADAGQSTTIDIGTTTSTVRVLNGGQLTLEDTVTVEGRGMLRGYGSGNTITSDGLIHANESSGYILIDPDNFTNTGTLRVSNGSALSLAGNWDNQGTIELNEGTLNLYDDFTTANINQSTFTRGSSTEVRLWGNLDNTGEVLDAIGDIHLHSSSSSVAGTIIGGTVNVDLHVTSGAYESVDGVTLNGTAHLTGGSDRLRVYNSLTLNGTADLSGSSSILEFDGGTQTLGADAGQSTTIDIGTTTSTVRVLNGGQLTLEDTVTVEGRGMLRGYGSGNTITSDGLIHANESSGYILIDPDNFTNTGTLRVSNGSALSLAGNWDNQGTIELNEGTLNLYDDFTTANINQSTFTRGSSTEVRLWGNLDNTGEVLDAIGDIHLHSSSSSVAGTIIGGTVNVDLHVTSGAYESVDGVTLNGTAHLTGGSDRLRVYNSLTLNGTADLSGSSSILEFDGGTQTLGADAGQTGLVQLGSSNSTLRVLDGGMLTLNERMVVEGRGRIRGYDGGNTVVNEGLIHANQAGGSIIIDPENFTNLGSLQVSGGSQLSLYENVTNYGSIEVGSGSTLGTFGLGTGGLDLLAGSVMRGDGIISGDLTNSAGTVEPNGLSVSSNYVQMASGTIHILAGGPAQGTEYDFLDISGAASLSGVLQLGLRDGFVPEIADTFTILEADGGVNGTFDEVVGLGSSGWSVSYLPTSVVVAFEGITVPEPGTFVLSLACMMMLHGFASSRRKRRV